MEHSSPHQFSLPNSHTKNVWKYRKTNYKFKSIFQKKKIKLNLLLTHFLTFDALLTGPKQLWRLNFLGNIWPWCRCERSAPLSPTTFWCGRMEFEKKIRTNAVAAKQTTNALEAMPRKDVFSEWRRGFSFSMRLHMLHLSKRLSSDRIVPSFSLGKEICTKNGNSFISTIHLAQTK